MEKMKTKYKILTFLFALTFLFGSAQNDKPQRSAFTLKLPVDSVRFYEQEVKQTPYFVKDNILQIYPGEKVFIEIEIDKSEIKSMKTVSSNVNPDKTITVELAQHTKNKKHDFMMLKIDKTFKEQLDYKAAMYIVGHNKWIPTNVLPVKALGAYETWSDVIITLVLSDWKLN